METLKNITKAVLIVLLCINTVELVAQNNPGEIKGKVFDEYGNPMPGASVWVEYMGTKIGTSSDLDGRFTIKPLNPGKYTVTGSYTGMTKMQIKNVEVKPGQIVYVNDIELALLTEEIDIYVVEEFIVPLIDPEETSKITMLASQIENSPNFRNPTKLLGSITSDVKVSEQGQVYFRGARHGSSLYFIDGVKTPDMVVPASGIASISVYSGGIPAKYGDTTGGVVIIETKNYFDLYNEDINNQLK